MTSVAKFVFSSFQENTYVLYDGTNECIIIDPGCHSPEEKNELNSFIIDNNLKPKRLINTHCHLDHVFGNRFIFQEYGLKPEIHEGELQVLEFAPKVAEMYGIYLEPSPMPDSFLSEGTTLEFGETKLEILFTPGHSPASISFFCRESNFLISGDVLFYGSIGRTDLPGGDYDTLINSIKSQLFPLGDGIKVYSGHGPETTIGFEKLHNPFLQD